MNRHNLVISSHAKSFKTFKEYNEANIKLMVETIAPDVFEKMENVIKEMDIDNLKLKSEDFSEETAKVVREGEDAIRNKIKETVEAKKISTLLTTLESENTQKLISVFKSTFLVFKTNTILLSGLNALKDSNFKSNMKVFIQVSEDKLVADTYLIFSMEDLIELHHNNSSNIFMNYMMYLVFDKYKIDKFEVAIVDLAKEYLANEIVLIDDTEILTTFETKLGIVPCIELYEADESEKDAFDIIETFTVAQNELLYIKKDFNVVQFGFSHPVSKYLHTEEDGE